MQARTCLSTLVAILGAVALVACSSATEGKGPGKGNKSGGDSNVDVDGPPIFEDDETDTLNPNCEQGDPNVDLDGDGYTPAQGDCNDCDPRMNPGAYDFPGNGVDEDCNGIIDDEPEDCDVGLSENGNSALDAAKALGICRVHDPAKGNWGVVHARWVHPNGQETSPCGFFGGAAPPAAQSRGLLTSFGPNVSPRHGSSMVAISSGIARAGKNGESPAGADMGTCSPAPPGFPANPPSCPAPFDPAANDGMALELEIRVPTNAKSMAFDFNFYTYEFPEYHCHSFNDGFVALLWSGNKNVPANKNISFDTAGNAISVNNSMVEVCEKNSRTPNGTVFPCSLGTDQLIGTGFEGHAATGWLTTSAGVIPGETIRLRFAIWDTGDHVLDSTALIDNFHWAVEEGEIVTKPVPK